jgi:peptidylprolyl isomerase/FKBP-type peptidyl-prolyl cis-trans isomerase FklB
MKKLLLILFVVTSISCSKDDEQYKEEWMLANQKVFNEIKSKGYTELKSLGFEGSIYYKVLNKSTDNTTILYTSKIDCYYKGWYVADSKEYGITTNKVFDQCIKGESPVATFTVSSGLINGWKTALQYMHPGDKWEIWIPYQLGYGSTGNVNAYTGVVSIPPYTTLVFELEVVKVY